MKFQYGTYNNYKARLIVYADICKKMLSDIGIETAKNIDFEIEMQENLWGLTTLCGNDAYVISINYILLDFSYMNEFVKKDKRKCPGLLNTIIHELLHTCKNSMDHGTEWTKNVKKVYEKYGIEIHETDSNKRKGIPNDFYIDYLPYALKCKKCGALFGYYNENEIPNIKKNYCGACAGKLIRIK
ncbi:MAG: hypothetical protein KBT48_09440 [Firmicutes bacterium]|nr:hypothetical protein [Bacillota bacterium]